MLPLEEVGQDADIKLTTDGNDKEDEEDDTLSSCSCGDTLLVCRIARHFSGSFCLLFSLS